MSLKLFFQAIIKFILGVLIAGLNYKYNWIIIPNIVVIVTIYRDI